MNRVLIIGLDGASPHLIRRWQEDLPHLNHLITGGASGTLWSVVPPRSVPAWYCFATGMNPAKLGVFGFSQRRPGTYDYTFANFSYCRAPAFWEWLSERGVHVGVLFVPGTFPPRPVNGFLVSGWPAPLNRGGLIYTHPPELSREIDRVLDKPFEFDSPVPIERDNEAIALPERLRITREHGQVAEHLLRTREWDVAVVVLTPIDRASHQFWKHMDPTHPQHNPDLAHEWGDALKRVYQAADEQVGRLLALVDDEDWVFVVSDHGFGPTHRVFYLNEWLREQGYLVLREEEAGRVGWRTRVLGWISAPLFWLNQASPTFRRLIAPLKKRRLSNFIRDEYVRARQQGLVRLNHLPVDWQRTQAYSPDESSLYLNIHGRDPQGIVGPNEVAPLLEDIITGLAALRHPEDGQPVTLTVHRKEEVYAGPYLAEAPELILAMDDYRTDVMAELGFGALFDPNPVRSANHTPEGILIARGPGIPAGSHVDAGLMDIAPTVVHLMGHAVPEEADGRVLLDLFETESAPRQRPIEYERAGLAEGEGEAYTEEELAQVEQQLRDLGYLG